jgi:hypothetical protein
MKYGKVLIIFMSAALLATPALAGAGKGYGRQVLSKSETRQVAAMKDMGCLMKDHSMGDHPNGKDGESTMNHSQTEVHNHQKQGR